MTVFAFLLGYGVLCTCFGLCFGYVVGRDHGRREDKDGPKPVPVVGWDVHE